MTVLSDSEAMKEYWKRSEAFWKQNEEFWKRFNSRPLAVTELKSVTRTEASGICLCGCGAEIDQPETGRKRHFYSASCRVKYNRNKAKK